MFDITIGMKVNEECFVDEKYILDYHSLSLNVSTRLPCEMKLITGDLEHLLFYCFTVILRGITRHT